MRCAGERQWLLAARRRSLCLYEQVNEKEMVGALRRQEAMALGSVEKEPYV